MWTQTHKGDTRCRKLADRHYSRQTPGHPMFTRPGYNFVLHYEDDGGEAVFVWWRPKWEDGRPGTARKDGLHALECTLFHNESLARSSDLIRAAVSEVHGWTRAHDVRLDDGLITGVNSEKTKARRGKNREPGYCFRMAGWIPFRHRATKRADVWLKAPSAQTLNLELFGCAGGMAEGFRRAGITFGLCFDFDSDACDSHERNMGYRPIQMDARDLLRMIRLGWHPGPIGLLVADPPCTPWSRAGKNLGLKDERDMLGETVELIRRLRPRAYLIGNVPGLQDASNWGVVQSTIGELRYHGYCVRDFVELNAANYGVPQMRIRPFWFGHLEGSCISWPAPTHANPVHPVFSGMELEPWVTCRDALSHLPLEELGRPVRLKRKQIEPPFPASHIDSPARTLTTKEAHNGASALVMDSQYQHESSRPARTMTTTRPDVLQTNEKHPPAQQDAPAPTVAAKAHGGQGADVLLVHPRHTPNKYDKISNVVTCMQGGGAKGAMEWPWDRPATTVCAEPRIPLPGHHAERSYMSNGVVLSEKARVILQGFPEGWVFCGATKKSRSSQIGQAMPPPLAEAVARSIKQQMEATE